VGSLSEGRWAPHQNGGFAESGVIRLLSLTGERVRSARLSKKNVTGGTAEVNEMLLAIAALLIQVPAIPQSSIPIATTAAADLSSRVTFAPGIVREPASPGIVLPTSRSLRLPAARGFVTPVYLAPAEPRYEQPSRRLWFTLSIAQHGAATFDAWSTRRVISSGQGQEQNLLLRPFAGNTSLYAAIQVGPALLDYLGRRMMKSQQSWTRHAWWLPQALGTAVSIACGVHNLGVASVPRARLP
jgi:hypothetical protein